MLKCSFYMEDEYVFNETESFRINQNAKKI